MGCQVRRYRPSYVLESELSDYGLPDSSKVKNIMTLVRSASTLIDEYCGRTDGNGNGTLAYATYAERLLLGARNRNILRVMFKPLVAITQDVANDLQASGNVGSQNNFWTGLTVNTITRPDDTLSPIISCSGRYGYPRRGEQALYPDLNYGMNLLVVASYFGGPPNFVTIDVSAIDFESQTGEMWVPAGIYMSQYTEIIVTYNSGYDPRNMPYPIKDSCAAIVKNLLAKGGTTGVRSLAAPGSVSVQVSESLIDPDIERWLAPFKTVTAY